ncbi:hypothetical protein [Paenarthrobacter sp. JL.01a]|uniref:hypothetical protein n=1 Tax=Paenarthrobacter sp. JL.01a TaxID=2979324 RepID=UPI0021CA1F97|nr:hypothetical protein [Paenarthrobacter sp. JL.01a]UXM90924.1 hypothetical protein N5P29_16735 [Paenarthrobacter sp. JL.01a]
MSNLTERIRGEISHHISPVIGWLRLDAEKGRSDDDGKRHDAWLERLDKATEAVAELVKPRTITATEELDALPDGSVVQSADIEFNGRTTPDIWSYRRGHWFCITAISIGGEVYRGPATEIALPATVLHEGGAA